MRTLADYGGLGQVFGFYLARRQFAGQQPDALGLLLDELAAAGAWAVGNPHAAAELLAPQVGLSVAVAEVWQRRTTYGVRPVDGPVLAAQQRIADLFFQHALIPKRVDIAGAVWRWHQ